MTTHAKATYDRERVDKLVGALQAAARECERLSDVRANRTRIIGNVHLIAQKALAEWERDHNAT